MLPGQFSLLTMYFISLLQVRNLALKSIRILDLSINKAFQKSSKRTLDFLKDKVIRTHECTAKCCNIKGDVQRGKFH